MTLLWAGVSIILVINSMWLLKLNKDLVERNEELIATIVIKDMHKVKVIKEFYTKYLETEINNFIKNKKVINVSCCFNNSTKEYTAVIHYQD